MCFLAHPPPVLDPITTLKLMYLSLYAVPFPGLTRGVLRQVRISIRPEEGRYVLSTCNACLLMSFCMESPISSWDAMNEHVDLLLEHLLQNAALPREVDRATLTFQRRRTRSKLRSCDASVAASGTIAKAVSALYSEGRKEKLIGAQIDLQNSIQLDSLDDARDEGESRTQDGCIHQLPRLRAGWVLPSAPEAAHRMDASVSPRGRSQDGCFRQLPRLLAGWVRCIHQVPRLRTGWVLPLAPEAARRMGAFVGSLGCAQDGCIPQLAERVQVERKLG
ncbi:hypothetical protein B0H11DRAFT_2194416 [Mycena galericulata]|nr:hypothetical protein B0H11DRAFT_2194416 [Mycena galericulata]